MLLAGLASLATGAAAQQPQIPLGFSWGPEETVEHDTNVLRASGLPGTTPIVPDTIYTTGLVGSFHETYGRDDISATASVGRVIFQRLSDYDFTQENIQANLVADLPLSANLVAGIARSAQLARIADIGNTFPDVVSTDAANATLDFPLASLQWRGVVAGNIAHFTNSSVFEQATDLDSAEGDLGVRYQPVSGNHLDLLARDVTATFPNAGESEIVNPGYHDHGADLRVDWALSGASHVQGRIGYVRRTYDPLLHPVSVFITEIFPYLKLDRDFSGPAYELTYNWQPTTATGIALYALRQTGAAGDNNYLSAVTQTYRLTASYRPHPKLQALAHFETTQLNYFSNIYEIVYGLPPGIFRIDHSHNIGATLLWSPRAWLQATLDVHREQRDSSIPFWIYADNVVQCSLQVTLF